LVEERAVSPFQIRTLIGWRESCLSRSNKNFCLINQSKCLFDLERQLSHQPIKICIWHGETVLSSTYQKLERQLSLQSFKIIFWPGETALSSTNQNYYLTWRDSSLFNQSKFLLNKTFDWLKRENYICRSNKSFDWLKRELFLQVK
jgi:hypothetical protein